MIEKIKSKNKILAIIVRTNKIRKNGGNEKIE